MPSPTEVEVIEASLLDVNYTSCYAPRAHKASKRGGAREGNRLTLHWRAPRTSESWTRRRRTRRLRGATAREMAAVKVALIRGGKQAKASTSSRRKTCKTEKGHAKGGTRQTACGEGGGEATSGCGATARRKPARRGAARAALTIGLSNRFRSAARKGRSAHVALSSAAARPARTQRRGAASPTQALRQISRTVSSAGRREEPLGR